jgi:23S rRNA (guanine2445-N2)-methyltransferase / 23S rRNA (guanine2069-N7)-methyltransferase
MPREFPPSNPSALPPGTFENSVSDSIPVFVSCGQGMEPLLAIELNGLGASEVRERRGGVMANVSWSDAYRICLWSRLASRVLLPLCSEAVADTDGLYQLARSIDWPTYFHVDRSFAIEVAGRAQALTHSHYAALKIKDAIADAFREQCGRRPDVSADYPDVRVHLHLADAACTLSLDLAGESLHRRGYRDSGGAAPLKENLAAALLLRAGWPEIAARGGALVDPLCGSGSLLIEAAWIAGDIAPGILRQRFGFQSLTSYNAAKWLALSDDAEERRRAGAKNIPSMLGQDIDAEALRSAQANARLAGIDRHIEWRQNDFAAARPIGATPGLLITNPPYGERLGTEADLIKLYSLLGVAIKQNFPGWRAAVFTGRPELGPRLGLRAEKIYNFYNGDLPCKLLLFDILQVDPSLPAAAGKAEDFANRLRKNHKHLAKWAKRSGVFCYRVYDADLPDYAVAIDLYPTERLRVHVHEYAPPKTIDPNAAERRLRDALAVIQTEFGVPTTAMHFKVRQQQKGNEQYSRQEKRSEFHEIDEHGCRLKVNLDDYVDTGIFLDHRPLRRRIQAESAGKRFLNLFCYTGTATVHAARGGALATCSVDLSANYLEWSRQNLELNGYAAMLEAPGAAAQTAWRGPRSQVPHGRSHAHRLLRADCLVWLREQAATNAAQRFDLILCDPPTFSNSKRMDDTLDVQRDHVELIENCMRLLTPGGTLYFSNNRRRFKLEAESLAMFDIADITAQTLDEDFKRPPPPHRCWMIRHR